MAKKTSKKNILKNLTIKNFRCFENFHLLINKLMNMASEKPCLLML